MAEGRPRVFSDIPRWATDDVEEQEKFFPDEPALEGPPKSAEESLFLSIPELSYAADIVVALNAAEGAAEKAAVIHRTVQDFLEDPRRLSDFFDAVKTLQDSKKYHGAKRAAGDIKKALPDALFETFPPSTAALERWITLYAESDVYQGTAEKILHKAMDACGNVEAMATLCYELALAGLRSSNDKVVKKTLQILGQLTPALPAASKAAVLFELAKLSPHESTFLKLREIDAAVADVSARKDPSMRGRIDAAVGRTQRHPDYRTEVQKLTTTNPTWVAGIRAFQKMLVRGPAEMATKIQAMHDTLSAGEASAEVAAAMDSPAAPVLEALARRSGPLKRWHDDLLAESLQTEGVQVVSLHLPNLHGIIPAERRTCCCYYY